MKEQFWHYGVSLNPKFYPYISIAIKSHVVFTNDGINPIESKSTQHRLRRKRGRNWWNRQWSNRLFTLINYLGDEQENIIAQVSSSENCVISKTPIIFNSDIDYVDPNLHQKLDIEEELDKEEEIDDEFYEEDEEAET